MRGGARGPRWEGLGASVIGWCRSSCWIAAVCTSAADCSIAKPACAWPRLADDELLIVWRKLPQPLALALPPRGLGLTGWRDPFVYWGGRSAADAPGSSTSAAAAAAAAGDGATSRQQASPAGYRMLLGSGFKGGGGALLGYSSDGGTNSCGATTLAEGWQYTGPVCSVADLAAAQAELAGGAAALGPAASADMSPAAAAHELGEVWECPLLAQLPAAEGAAAAAAGGEDRGAEPPAWLLAVSPYPVKPPHSPSNPVLYWVGGMDGALSRQAGSTAAFATSSAAPHGSACTAAQACMPHPPAAAPAAGLSWPRHQAPSDWTVAMCCMHPMSAPMAR